MAEQQKKINSIKQKYELSSTRARGMRVLEYTKPKDSIRKTSTSNTKCNWNAQTSSYRLLENSDIHYLQDKKMRPICLNFMTANHET